MQPSQLGALSSADALTVAMALNSNSGQQLSPQMAMSLGILIIVIFNSNFNCKYSH